MNRCNIPGALNVEGGDFVGVEELNGQTGVVRIVDEDGNEYGADEGDITVPRGVTSANRLTGDVKWLGGNRIRVNTEEPDTIRIEFDSDASGDQSDPWESSNDPCEHPGDDEPGNEGGVAPDDAHGVVGGDGAGGVSASGDPHIGDDPCCGPR